MSKIDNEISMVNTKLRALVAGVSQGDARALRRAALTLHRWYEHECNGVIQRDENTGIPYRYSAVTNKRLSSAPDREKGATRTIKKICERLGLHFYLQTDPRGGTLYVDTKPIADNNYTRATFIA